MKHDYRPECQCYRCKGIRNSPLKLAVRARKPRAVRERIASREEQHGRYLDSGPQAWDDRD